MEVSSKISRRVTGLPRLSECKSTNIYITCQTFLKLFLEDFSKLRFKFRTNALTVCHL